jgi:hypothetical protein
MATPPFDTDIAHRWFGVEFNNAIFPLLAKESRTDDETDEMIALAYSAWLHWRRYSGYQPINGVRAENMIATVLCFAERKEGALFHAIRNYSMISEFSEHVEDFDIAYALMILARSHALNNHSEQAKDYYNQCKEAIEHIGDVEDKKIVQKDFASGKWYGINQD